MMRFFDKTKGSVSIFLILVLFPVYTCACLAIDSVRYSAAKAKVGGALELTGNSALADYDKTFKELYGIFVMSKSESELSSNLISYYSNMTDSTELSLGDATITRKLIKKMVNVTFENTVNTQTKDLSLSYEKPVCDPAVLEESIRDFMKYRAPYNWVRGFSQKLSAFSQTDKMSDVIDESKGYYKSVSKAESELKGLYDALKSAGELTEPDEKTEALNNIKKILPSVKEELKASSEKAEKWSDSIENLDNGEVKELFKGEYKNTAALLGDEAIDNFSKTLDRDVAALKKAKKEAEAEASENGLTEIDLQYQKDPFFLYLSSMYGKSGTVQGDAQAQKSAIETIADTDINSYAGEESALKISELVTKSVLEAINESCTEDKLSPDSFSKVKDSAKNIYEAEYISEMFGCLTTKETDFNLMNSDFSQRPLLTGEIEYIVFGNDSLMRNVSLCVELIFAIRLILNSVYVYTNAGMRQTALAVAAAVAGWTGIGIPAAQNALLISWAMAESVLDTASLCRGETVPVYKTAYTWTLGIKSLPETLAKGAAGYACKGIDDVFEKIESCAFEKTDEVRDAALSYMEQSGKGAVESLTSMIIIPVEKTVTSLTSGINPHVSRENVYFALLEAVNGVEASSSGVEQAKQLFIKYCLDALTDKIYESIPQLFTSDETLAQQASAKITKALSDAYSSLFSEVEKIVFSVTDEAKASLQAALESASSEVKRKTVNVVNDYAKTLSKFVGESDKGAVSEFSGFGMTYKEYLKLFVLIGLCGEKSKDKMLKRSALIMQINCEKRDQSFDITKCYRGVNLFSETFIGTHTIKFEENFHY